MEIFLNKIFGKIAIYYIFKKIKYISMSSKEFIRGTLKTIILKLLAENKQLYGYEISQKVAELSKDEIKLTYGALYPVLYKLEGDGLLVTASEIVNGRVRKYYSLTQNGHELAKEKVSELQKFTEILSKVLTPIPQPKMNLSGI